MGKRSKAWCIAAAITTLGMVTAAEAADPIKIGVIIPMTGGFQSNGKQIEAAINAYTKAKGDTVAGRKIEFVLRDDRGAPDKQRDLARSLSPRIGSLS